MAGKWLRGRGEVVAAACLAIGMALAGCQPKTIQGWTETYRAGWYNADQGSRLMPWPWMQALEQPVAQGAAPPATPAKFMDSAYLASFRILPPYPGSSTGLPIGFAIDQSSDTALEKTHLRWYEGQKDGGQWVGLNCAACHTGEVDYQGKVLRVDGAPSLFDFQSFIEAVDQALAQTRDDAAANGPRWDRFAKAVLGTNDSAKSRADLLQSLNQLLDWEQQTATLNATDLRYGYGRVDAVGHIFNRILLFGGAPQPTPNPADAPVSYPHLWNITKETQLQWDGIATNAKIDAHLNPFAPDTPFDYGAMGRNVGEVLGVFGDTTLKPPAGTGFPSSVDAGNLNNIEVTLTKLQPPVWPSDWFGQPGAVDVSDASGQKLSPQQVLDAGKTVFDNKCAQCHTPHQHYETMVTFADLGPKNLTDEWMACNAWAYTGASGRLTGVKDAYVTGRPLAASEAVNQLLTTAVKGVMVAKAPQIAWGALQDFFGVTPPPQVVPPSHARNLLAAPPRKQAELKLCMDNASNPLMAYKARPLEGIWATAPYLHNGSVPTLYDLLLAPAQRPVTFQIGTRQFDPKHVGYAVDASAAGNSFTFDTRLAGNANKGHDYGVGALSDAQRLELLEYLKTL